MQKQPGATKSNQMQPKATRQQPESMQKATSSWPHIPQKISQRMPLQVSVLYNSLSIFFRMEFVKHCYCHILSLRWQRGAVPHTVQQEERQHLEQMKQFKQR
jgi:hypothetical protein